MRKEGRPRKYNLSPIGGVRLERMGWYLAGLDELRCRVADQVCDLPRDALNHVFPEIRLSIGQLLLHLAWAEASWMRRISSRATEAVGSKGLIETLRKGSLELFSESPPEVDSAGAVLEVINATRDEITLPTCVHVTNLEAPVADPALTTVEMVMHHLLWHWTYHSGHIGILSFELGFDYTWRFDVPTV